MPVMEACEVDAPGPNLAARRCGPESGLAPWWAGLLDHALLLCSVN